MPDAVIENPILNSPFRVPSRHWRFGDTTHPSFGVTAFGQDDVP